MAEMELVGVRVEAPSNSPVVVLREMGGSRRILPIFIGAQEATAIAFALEEVVTLRPMTHDLFRNVLEELGVTLEKVTVTEIRDGVFHAELELNAADGIHTISSRSSDAIALAARTGSPIHASDELLSEAGFVEESVVDVAEDPQVVEEFREFIDSVNPEDFEL